MTIVVKLIIKDIKESLDISCIVLAGGKGVRLGQDKTAVTVGGKTLLQQVVSRLSLFKSDIIIVTAEQRTLPQLIDYPKLKAVADLYPGKGSLGGIFTGLVNSSTFYNVVVACDMPFLNFDLLSYMLAISSGYDIVVPKIDDRVEPLHAVYSKNCISPMESILKQGVLTIIEAYKMVKVRYVVAEEIDKYDPKHLSFFNINTESELKIARELVRGNSIVHDKC